MATKSTSDLQSDTHSDIFVSLGQTEFPQTDQRKNIRLCVSS